MAKPILCGIDGSLTVYSPFTRPPATPEELEQMLQMDRARDAIFEIHATALRQDAEQQATAPE